MIEATPSGSYWYQALPGCTAIGTLDLRAASSSSAAACARTSTRRSTGATSASHASTAFTAEVGQIAATKSFSRSAISCLERLELRRGATPADWCGRCGTSPAGV